MEKQNEEEEEQKKKKKSSVVIRIPSYQEVVESSQAKSTPSSLFVPSQTFSEAFAFVKSSDFYSPPPKSRYTRFPTCIKSLNDFINHSLLVCLLVNFSIFQS